MYVSPRKRNRRMTEAEHAVRRFIEGDEDAFAAIAGHCEGRIYNLAWRFLGNREDAQDVVQETLLLVYRHAKSLRNPGSFTSWLYRIALNQCRAHRRSRPPEVPLEPLEYGMEAPGGVASGRPLAGNSARDPVEVRDLVRKALAGLSEEHRSAVILKEYVGLTLEEVATVMDCPLSTAKSRLYHGLHAMQRRLARAGIRS